MIAERFDAVLPAGGRIAGAFAGEAGTAVKAMIAVDGRTLLDRAVDGIRATGRCSRAVVIGGDEVAAWAVGQPVDGALPDGGNGIENLFRGLTWLGSHPGAAERVLISATDLPFLSADAVGSFVDRCPVDADVCVPIIDEAGFSARFPGLGGEYVALRGRRVTMGSVFLVRPAALLANRARLDAVFLARKSQLGMVRLLGFRFVLRFAMRLLSVQDIEQRCGELLGCRGFAVDGAPAELAFDVDLPEELHWVRQHAGAPQETPD